MYMQSVSLTRAVVDRVPMVYSVHGCWCAACSAGFLRGANSVTALRLKRFFAQFFCRKQILRVSLLFAKGSMHEFCFRNDSRFVHGLMDSPGDYGCRGT